MRFKIFLEIQLQQTDREDEFDSSARGIDSGYEFADGRDQHLIAVNVELQKRVQCVIYERDDSARQRFVSRVFFGDKSAIAYEIAKKYIIVFRGVFSRVFSLRILLSHKQFMTDEQFFRARGGVDIRKAYERSSLSATLEPLDKKRNCQPVYFDKQRRLIILDIVAVVAVTFMESVVEIDYDRAVMPE